MRLAVYRVPKVLADRVPKIRANRSKISDNEGQAPPADLRGDGSGNLADDGAEGLAKRNQDPSEP